MSESNPIGLDGIAFVEYAAPGDGAERLDRLFQRLGFSRVARHREHDVLLYAQHGVAFLVDREPGSFGARFAAKHGPGIPSMGWWVEDAERAIAAAVARGAQRHEGPTHYGVPAIVGIGGSLIHLVPKGARSWRADFLPLDRPVHVRDRGFVAIDHLTNNVEKGTLAQWSRFYREVFGFTDVRHFDIRGQKTGLQSYALRSPCGSFCIPINEGSEDKSQIEEYLREYHGPGIQHIALTSGDLLASLEGLNESGVETLDIDDDYYDSVFERVPHVREDHARIRALRVLVDGDDDGYLLQIFTRNVIGPIFFEMIQRHNHLSFGEGNFGALFRSIERDQERRGVL
jgi:4-hydroxyphenylpyruvate dioxygenase